MRARKTETEIRKEQIIEAALDQIGAEGVYALSISGIARRVGIVPSAFYRHFNSKEDVLAGVLETVKTRLLKNVVEVRRETPDAVERLRLLMMRHVHMLNNNRAVPYIVFSDGIYTGDRSLKTKVVHTITTYLNEVQKIFEEGVHAGILRQDVAPATAAVMFLGVILPAAVLSNLTRGGFDMIGHVENAWSLFARSITRNEWSKDGDPHE
jgi:AcrR family transcriptional regulator